MQVRRSDVLVIGSGGAGVTAAVEAARAGATVTIISKEPLGYGDTRISLGVMSTSPDSSIGDSEEQFAEDMIRGGEGLNDPKLVGVLVREALEATATFESFGHLFDRDQDGKLKRHLVPPGGHRASRAVGSPAAGVSMGHTMRSAAARADLEVLEETVCFELLVKGGEATGATAIHLPSGEPVALLAKSTIIAAGGAGSLYYPHTDCMPSVTGDSYGLGLGAGCELVDMEQVQYLPFAITHPPALLGAPCGEPVVAGPFGRLLNNRGETVLEGIMPMTRAQVARSIVEEIRRGGATEHGGLLLDLRPNLASPQGEFFVKTLKKAGAPILSVVRRAYGRKAADLEEPWEVLPSAHYHMGGIKTDERCRSTVAGLYACGQAQGGVMGGNRLGSTSLTEIFVFGKRAGRTAAREAKGREHAEESLVGEPLAKLGALRGSEGAHRPIHLKRALQRLMWERVGPLRDADGLEEALEGIDAIEDQARNLRISGVKRCNAEVADAVELPHMIATARAIAISALGRNESRGAHVRSDFPEREEAEPVKNMIVKMTDGGCSLRQVAAGR
jgi:succinate dehydrogenase/fumarate reductase flavoprotein subunit